MFTGLPDEANDVSGQFATALAVVELHSYLGAVNSRRINGNYEAAQGFINSKKCTLL